MHFKRIKIFIITCIAMGVFIVIPPLNGNPQVAIKEAGYISVVKGAGKAFIIRKAGKILIVGMDIIKKEDTIEVPRNVRLIVNLKPGTGYEVPGPAQFIIKTDVLQFSAGGISRKSSLDRKLFTSILEELLDNGRYAYDITYTGGTLNKSKSQKYGSITMRGTTDKLTLKTSILLSWRPFLYWDRVPGATNYRVKINSDTATVCEAQSKTCAISEMPQCKELKSGEYIALIEALDKDNNVIKKGEGVFTASSDKNTFNNREKAIIDRIGNESETSVLLGRFYEKYDLISDALTEYRKAFDVNKDNDGLREKINFLSELIK